MPSSSANPLPVQTSETSPGQPASPVEPATIPQAAPPQPSPVEPATIPQAAPPQPPPQWLQAWPWQAQWSACMLLMATICLLVLRGLGNQTSHPSSSAPGWAYRVEVNQAGNAELLQLPGVGPQLAQRIEDYRHQHGGFEQVNDLVKVPGIGPAKLERIRPWVQVSAATKTFPPPPNPATEKPPKKSKKEAALTGPPIDVNTADAALLQKLPRIGPKMSQRIIDERSKKPFATVDDLRRVSGIGPKTLENLRPYVTVGSKKPSLLTSQGLATSGYNEEN